MDARIVARQLRPCQALPEVNMLLALGIGWLSSHNPSMRSFTVRANNHVGIKPESEK